MRTVSIRTGEGLTLVGDEWGDPSGPPVLMLHGAGQSRHAWKRTSATLSDAGWFVLAVDARGHGDSDWSAERRYDMDDTGGDVLDLLERFDRPPVVIGASMGGMAALAAQDLANQATGDQALVPDGGLFRALVLVDIAPGFTFDGAVRVIDWMAANPDGFSSLQEASDAMAAYNPHRPRPKDLSGLRRVLRQGEDGRWRWRWDPDYILSKPGFANQDREAMRIHMERMNDRLMGAARSIDQPLLLVRGGQSDLVTPEVARAFVDAVPGTEFVDVAGTGHMVAGDDNDAFTAAVVEFLDRRVGSTEEHRDG